MTPTEQDEEQLEQAINSLFMVGYDIGRTAKIILSAEDLRSHLENNAITDRQKVDMAANPHKDKLLHIINTQKRLYAESIQEQADDMARFIAALLIQSGGSVKVTNRTLKEIPIPSSVNFERFDNVDGSIEFRLKKEANQ